MPQGDDTESSLVRYSALLHESWFSFQVCNNAWIMSQCQFGEHLLPLCPELPIALVEAEKTAVICSAVFPEFLWLATGGLGQFNDRVKVLLGRQVLAFPDLGAVDRGRQKAKDYPLLDITVSDYQEKTPTPQQPEMGADLADLVVEERRNDRASMK